MAIVMRVIEHDGVVIGKNTVGKGSTMHINNALQFLMDGESIFSRSLSITVVTTGTEPVIEINLGEITGLEALRVRVMKAFLSTLKPRRKKK